MDAKNYKITCLSCEGSSRLSIINGAQVIYKDHVPIIAARLRGDMKWGFECMCGNDSRLAITEKKDIEQLVQGGKFAIAKLAETLKVKDELKFRMELV